nr:forkhead box protein D2-like [Taeniopygia guttata]
MTRGGSRRGGAAPAPGSGTGSGPGSGPGSAPLRPAPAAEAAVPGAAAPGAAGTGSLRAEGGGHPTPGASQRSRPTVLAGRTRDNAAPTGAEEGSVRWAPLQ